MKHIYSSLIILLLLPTLTIAQGILPSGEYGMASPAAKNKYPTVQSGNASLGQMYNNTACGLNFTTASQKLGQRFHNATASSCDPYDGVAQPATLTISGIPTCYVIDKAFLWCSTSGNGVAITATLQNPLGASANFPMTIVGTDVDKGWGATGSYTYRVDVTSAITGNGNYIVSGLPTYPNYPVTGNDVDGATLFIIYRDLNATYSGTLVINDGCMVDAGGETISNTVSGFSTCANSQNGLAFLIVSDMQDVACDNQLDNQITIEGTTYVAVQEDWWNVLGVAETITPGQTTMSFSLSPSPFAFIYGTDLFDFLVAGVYFQTTSCTVCTPTAIASTTSFIAATCGNKDGTATANPSGGSGNYTYSWTTSPVQTGQTATGLGAGTYTVTITDNNGCMGTASVTITGGGAPTISINPGPTTICKGASTSLTGAGGTAYTWSPSSSLSSGSGTTVTASPTTTTTYTVTGTNGSGCSNTSTVTITVNSLPTVGANASPSTAVCAGASVTLNGTGAATYGWSGGVTNGVSFIPASTATYTVTGTTSGCSNTAAITVTVNPLPTVGANALPSTTICAGSSVTLSGTGATTYSWTGGVTNGVSFAPASTATYTVTGTTNGCSGTATITINVNLLPTVNAVVLPSDTICVGTQVTLSGTGATSYNWSGGVTNGVSFVPASTATYTVTGTTNGCSNTASITVNVNPLPIVNAVALPSTTICPGSSVTLNGTGATTYSWSGGVTNGVSFVPASTATYTVTGTTNGCSNTASITITVNSSLTLNAVALPGTTICAGSSVTLSGTGATTYSWSGGVTDGVSFVPVSTATYTVTGTTNGCSNTATITITVNSLPNVNAVALPSSTICAGSSVALSGTGATTYSWSGGVTNGVSFAPASTATYTVTGITNGCSNTATITITVNQLPVVNAVAIPASTVCAGSSETLSGTGAAIYSWSGGVTDGVSFVPVSTATYTVTGTTNGCSNTATIMVTVNPLPTVGVNAIPSTAICSGSSVTLNGTGAITYSWSGGATNGVSFVPSATATYTITGTSNGCSNTSTITITVNSIPTVGAAALPSTVLCAGSSVTLSGTGATTYSWSGGITDGASFVPSSTDTYTVTGTSNGCSNTATITITVNPLPTVGTNALPSSAVCAGQSVTLNGTGATTYTWSGGITNDVSFVPASTETYTVTGTSANGGCSNTATITITVNPLPVVNAGPDTTVCNGSTVQLNAGGGSSYQWTPATGLSDSTSATSVATVTDTTVYTVTVSTGACTATGTVTIQVYPVVPTPGINQSGDTLSCTYNPAYVSYQWYYNDTIIANATKSFYVATRNGNYNVAVTDKNGCEISVGINIVLNNVLSIAELSEQISLYPNPATDELFINGFGVTEKCSITIFNMIGEKVQEENIKASLISSPNERGSTNISVSNLSAGVYFIQVLKDNGKWVGRFVKE